MSAMCGKKVWFEVKNGSCVAKEDARSSGALGDEIPVENTISGIVVRGVVKGAGSVIFDANGTAVCGHGNPGMATAGMGDVLSGVTAGCVAQDIERCGAMVRAAVLMHSRAADLATAEVGERSLVATDVIRMLPKVLK